MTAVPAVPPGPVARPGPGLPTDAGEQVLRARVRWGLAWVVPTRHGWGLLLVAALLWISWRLARLELLASLALLLAAPVLVALVVAWCLVLAWALPRPWLSLSLPALPQVGQQVLVRARAAWRLPRFLPTWILWRVTSVGGDPGDTALTPLDQEGTVLGVQARHRGPAVVEVARLCLREPLGLVGASVPVGTSVGVLVLPRPVAPDRALTRPRASRPGGTRVGAAGEEHLASLRDYRPGDALASVHWKQSARADHLLVTEREPEYHLHARLALVAGRGWSPQPEQAETAISLAAGLVAEWSTRQHLGVELSVLLGSPVAPGGAGSPADPGPPGWRLLRWDAEAGDAHRLLRVLAVLDLRRPDGRTPLLPPGAWQEPDTCDQAPRLLGADVVVAGASDAASPQGGAQSDADRAAAVSAACPGSGALPALDPASRGALVVVGGQAGNPAQGQGLPEVGGPGSHREHGVVPLGWQVLTVDAASGEVVR